MSADPNLKYKNLDKIFYPESVAVVGANRVAGTVPCDIFLNILKSDFQGVVYPVSPRDRFIASVKTYKYIIDIEDPIDLAVIVFPSSVCNRALEQCGQKGVKSAIIISAGFKEIGGIGAEREKELKEIASKYNISFIGPNCLGVINTDPRVMLNASFARNMPEEGSIAFLSQSGALCTAVLDFARARHIGFSKFVSFGNKADITEIDLLYYLKDDPRTKVILIYLEEITDGSGLMKAARAVIEEAEKPILAIKSGRTTEGATAAASHTGSLAGSDEVCDAAFKQAGIIRCENIEEMFNKAIAMTYQPRPKNNRVAIITNAGGPGVLTTDATVRNKLELARFSEETTQIFKRSLPKTANIKNPVDVIGDARADRYSIALSTVLKDPNVDGVFVILTPQSMTDIDTIALEISKVAAQSDKPIYASFMGEADVASGIGILQKNKIPHYFLPETMPSAFAAAYQFNKRLEEKTKITAEKIERDRDHALETLNATLNEGRKFLLEHEAIKVLKAYGIPIPESGLATTEEEAEAISQLIGFPVVMKVVSEDILHKFDVQGVVLNIKSQKEAKIAFQKIIKNVSHHQPKARIKGVFVSKMILEGEEVILGIKRDPAFGGVVMFGLGGIYVEIFRDVSFRIAPVDRKTAEAMVREIKSSAILFGARGTVPRDTESLVNCILALSQLAMDFPQIQELDINPLIVLEKGKGCYVADAKIML